MSPNGRSLRQKRRASAGQDALLPTSVKTWAVLGRDDRPIGPFEFLGVHERLHESSISDAKCGRR
jgi:hypothetical protein